MSRNSVRFLEPEEYYARREVGFFQVRQGAVQIELTGILSMVVHYVEATLVILSEWKPATCQPSLAMNVVGSHAMKSRLLR